jgi:hypothetical protein
MINIIISSCVILGEVQDTLTIRRLKHDIDEEINIHPLLHSDGIQKNKNVCTSLLLINNGTLPCVQPVSCHQ